MAERRSLASYLLLVSIILGWLFDFLFWNKAWGISFPIFIALCLGAGFWMARRGGVRIGRQSLWLLLPIAFFALATVFRREPLSAFLSHSLTLLLMGILAVSFISGRWLNYGVADYLSKLGSFFFDGLFTYRKKMREAEHSKGEGSLPFKRISPIGRGLLIALPILLILGALLASADPIFANWLEDIFAFALLENMVQSLWRIVLIVIVAYILMGAYAYAFWRSRDEKLIGEDKALIAPFIGYVESLTVLISVEVLFAIFVSVQLRYFFGGAQNINLAGYTYAEYARRGFGELVMVAVLSIGLFALLSSFGRREEGSQRRWFSRLGVALFALVSIILVSAYQRLLLYEGAYGFTPTRIHVHAFMIWLGIYLITLVILEIRGQWRAFAPATLLVAIGFAASLNTLNVEATIVRANAERLRASGRLDIAHLSSLSNDAAPPLVEEINASLAQEDERSARQLLAALGCHAMKSAQYPAPAAWQSITLTQRRASQAWTDFRGSEAFERLELPASEDWERWEAFSVRVDGVEYDCWESIATAD